MESKVNIDIFKSDSLIIKNDLKTTLQSLQKKHKNLSLKRVQYLEESFSDVLDSYKGNVQELEALIRAITPHTFNDHTMCKTAWCLELQKNVSQKNEISFSKRRLIMDLKHTFSTLFHKLIALIKFSQNVNKETNNIKILPNDNPNLQIEIHPHQLTNAIKNKELNAVSNHAVQDRETLNLSASTGNVQGAGKRTSQNRKRNMIEKSDCEPVQKKSFHSIPDTGKYTTENKRNEVPNTTTTTKCSNKTKCTKKKKPKPQEMDINDLKSHTTVFFDLETTSLMVDCDIVQIGAIDNNGEFNTYVIPNKMIDPGASAVTGLTFEQRMLKYRGKPVHAVSRSEALHKFLEWLQLRSPAVLYAHNASFDYRRLFLAIKEENMVDIFKQHILGFVNTIAQFRVIFPKLPNYKQSTVVEMVLKKSYEAHNALGDVRALKELYNISKSDVISKGSVTFSSAYDIWLYNLYGQI